MTSPVDQYDVGATTAFSPSTALRRPNVIRDSVAGVLLALALLLPWNIYFGVSIGGTAGWVFGLLVLATLLPLAALALSHVGPMSTGDGASLTRLRLLASTPYFALVIGFLAFTVIQSIRTGGTPAVPPGIGPGAWLGAAGAVLAAQPVISAPDGGGSRYGAKVSRTIGVVSLVLAVAAVVFNVYWRTRFVVPNIGDPDTGMQNSVVAVAAVLYGAVALLPVIITARWLMSATPAHRLATVLLGASTLIGGLFVWVLPVGRDLDAFHGIAQNTSTAGVGFEGYLAWAAVAAVIGTATLLSQTAGASPAAWRGAVRKCLVLMAVWCGGSALLRIVDMMSTSVLDLPAPPYNTIALMAFDLLVGLLAMWLFINTSTRDAAPSQVMTLLLGVLFVFTVCRVIVGQALVPRVEPLNTTDINDVYGNTLSQQITSTFDVVLCLVGLALLAIVLVRRTATERQPQPVTPVVASEEPAAPTVQFTPATVGLAGLGGRVVDSATVRIARQAPAPARDRVADVLAESTKRFAAGTTYGGGGAGGSKQP